MKPYKSVEFLSVFRM